MISTCFWRCHLTKQREGHTAIIEGHVLKTEGVSGKVERSRWNLFAFDFKPSRIRDFQRIGKDVHSFRWTLMIHMTGKRVTQCLFPLTRPHGTQCLFNKLTKALSGNKLTKGLSVGRRGRCGHSLSRSRWTVLEHYAGKA